MSSRLLVHGRHCYHQHILSHVPTGAFCCRTQQMKVWAIWWASVCCCKAAEERKPHPAAVTPIWVEYSFFYTFFLQIILTFSIVLGRAQKHQLCPYRCRCNLAYDHLKHTMKNRTEVRTTKCNNMYIWWQTPIKKYLILYIFKIVLYMQHG